MAWERDPVTFAPVGGESGQHVLDRALPALNARVRAHAGTSILAVSTSMVIAIGSSSSRPA
jgi:probable phosphoglycerate mutase